MPLFPPLHETEVVLLLAVRVEGCVIVTVVEVEHPFGPVTRTVYVPALRPVAVAVPCPPPGAGDQEYVKGPVPEATLTVALPFVPPWQLAAVGVAVTPGRPVKLIVVSILYVHPFAWVTTTS